MYKVVLNNIFLDPNDCKSSKFLAAVFMIPSTGNECQTGITGQADETLAQLNWSTFHF